MRVDVVDPHRRGIPVEHDLVAVVAQARRRAIIAGAGRAETCVGRVLDSVDDLPLGVPPMF
jgi:hypothetical protein